MSKIVAILHGEHGAYGISFPDLPGATSGGATVDETLARAEAFGETRSGFLAAAARKRLAEGV